MIKRSISSGAASAKDPGGSRLHPERPRAWREVQASPPTSASPTRNGEESRKGARKWKQRRGPGGKLGEICGQLPERRVFFFFFRKLVYNSKGSIRTEQLGTDKEKGQKESTHRDRRPADMKHAASPRDD